jgi:hypothetical protein
MPTSRPRALALAILLSVGVVGGCLPVSGEVAGAVGSPGAIAVVPASSAPSPSASVAPSVPASIAPSPSPTTAPTAYPSALPAAKPVRSGPFEMDLYHKGDFVSQTTKEHCVSAAMQIMLNIAVKGQDGTARTQADLARLARELSASPTNATEPLGWALGLRRRGAGHYKVMVAPTRGAALRRAVRAIRATGRPVGLLVWRGAHSWVLHGFTATADPATSSDFRITGLWISDPWYPRISSIWGPSRAPDQLVKPERMGEDYLRWRRPTGRYPGMDGRFVLVVPVDDPA